MTSKKRWLPWAAKKAHDAETSVDVDADVDIEAADFEAAATTGEPVVESDEAVETIDEPVVTTAEPEEEETARRRFLPSRKRAGRRPAVGGGLMRPFNLLPKKEVVEKTPTVGIGRLAAIGAIVVGIVGLGVWYAVESQGLDSAESDRDDLVELLEQPAPAAGGASVGQAQRALFADQLLRTDAIAGVLNERVAWDRVLTSVARVFPKGVWFTGMTATTPAPLPEAAAGDDSAAPDPTSLLPRLTISGFAEDHEQLAVLMGRLSALRELEDVQLESSGSTLIGTTDAVQFSVSTAVTPGRTS